jgi:hypothetical protein
MLARKLWPSLPVRRRADGSTVDTLPHVAVTKRWRAPRVPSPASASRAHWDRIEFEERRWHAEIRRGYHDAWRARIAAGEQ